MKMDCNFVRTVALRVIAAALAVVCGVDSASAGSFCIAFAGNDGSTNSITSPLSGSYINNNLSKFLSKGSDYVDSFDKSNFANIYRAKSGYGWIIGDPGTAANVGKFKIIFSELGQVKVTGIKVVITAYSNKSINCAISVNDGAISSKSISVITDREYTFSFTVSPAKLESLYLSSNGVAFYLRYIDIEFEDPAVMAFDANAVSVNYAQDVDVAEPTLTNPNGVDVAYSSDNEGGCYS